MENKSKELVHTNKQSQIYTENSRDVFYELSNNNSMGKKCVRYLDS
jgi:hypothetical protein